MDRERAFVEYGRILKNAADWIARGYRDESDAGAEVVRPPEAAFGSGAAEGRSVGPDEAVLAGKEPAGRDRPASGTGGDGSSAPQPAVPVSGGAGPSDRRENDPFRGPGDERAAELREIADTIRECRDCNLYLIRENTVPGIGQAGAVLMIVTPPPVDRAGENDGPLPPSEAEYLGKWLSALGLDSTRDVFVTPAVKCRTPGGRSPHAEEAAACSGHLRRQYKAVRPRAVLALGDAACGALTGSAADFPSLVGRDWTWGSVPALVLWTPAEVLANPSRLRKPVWDALQRLKASWNVAGTGL